MSADRGFVLAAVDAVQRAADALDTTDATCAKGAGVPARTALRTAEPLTRKAREQLAALPRTVAAYRRDLQALTTGAADLEPAQRAAVQRVATAGKAEAAAVMRFRSTAAGLWPEYDRLATQQDTWVTRAVTPWYRSDAEGAAAYAVLVDGSRPALERARAQLATAATAVQGPSRAQTAAMAAADEALAALRAPE